MNTAPVTVDDALDTLEASLDSDFLKALCEPGRVQIVKILIRQGACDVNQIAAHLPQERSVISRHLKVLTRAGLVQVERVGRHRVHRLVPSTFIGRMEEILASTRRCIALCCPPETNA